eukprot:2571179-Rhodomonas_salina.2
MVLGISPNAETAGIPYVPVEGDCLQMVNKIPVEVSVALAHEQAGSRTVALFRAQTCAGTRACCCLLALVPLCADLRGQSCSPRIAAEPA